MDHESFVNMNTEPPTPPLTDFQELGTPEQLAELYGALAMARGEFTKIVKGRTVTITPKEGRPYTFNYAELDDSLAAVVPALSKHGLVVIQPFSMLPNKGPALVRTILAHKAGARLVSMTELLDWKDAKGLGGVITYLRRYSLNAMLCLAADEDADEQPLQSRGEAHAESRPRNQPNVPRREASGPARGGEPAASRPTVAQATRAGSTTPTTSETGQNSETASDKNASSGEGEALAREQQESIRNLCIAAGATNGADQKALISGLLSPHGEQRLSQANYKRVVTDLGRLAIGAKEQANG